MAATAAETVELLGQVPVFAELARDDLVQVAAVAVPRRFATGQVVFREGDASDTCYVVRSGHARAVRAHPDGRTLTLANFGPGDIFGELAMFDDELRSATVETLDDMEAVAILGPDMRRLLSLHPDIAVKLLTAVARRLRVANERLARQSFSTVQTRVATVLRELVAEAQREGASDGDVLVTATQADLAQLAGSSRESASRFLATLERAGVISQGRGRLTVHDPAALDGYAHLMAASGKEFSAGGVVVRDHEVLAIRPRKRGPDGRAVLGLPKGHPEAGESPEEAATREIREETGVEAELVDKLGDIRYWYRRNGRDVAKVVSFFLFRYLDGDPVPQPEEIEEVRWIPLEEAVRELTFEGEREMAVRALSRLDRGR